MIDEHAEHAFLTLDEGTSTGDARWAFGTGFHDPLHGIDTALPAGAKGGDLAAYCLALGDDALIAAQRLMEWCGSAPELEEEVALANIGLDLLGQARLLLSRAGQADGSGRTEDDLAFLRDEGDFRNVRIAEMSNGDFARTIAKLLVFSSWRLALFERLTSSADPVLAGIAAKGVKELAYHRDHAAQWTVRLGDGTAVSRERMQHGLDDVWPYVEELFTTHELERRAAAAGFGVDPVDVREETEDVIGQVVRAAGLELPSAGPLAGVGGKTGRDGVHTEVFGYLLSEMQCVARANPGATW
jgi:ring-1,2-phenylacetyl-CoA epoxidase subunit PaaC